MDGLECSEIRMSDVCDTTTLRFDSDYYKKEYLEIEQFICKNRDKFVTIESQGLQVDASAFYPSLEPYYNTGTIPFVRVADVKDQIEYNACVNIPEMGEEFRTLHMCYPGDVVLTKGGRVGTAGLITQPSYVTRDLIFINASALSRKDYIVLYLFVVNNDVVFASMGVGSLGKVSLFSYDGDKPFVTDSTLRIYRAKKHTHVLPEVLCIFLQSAIGQELIYRYVVGSTGIINIYDDDIAKIPIPILDGEIQKDIAEKVQNSFALRRQSKQLLEYAKQAVEMAIEQGEDAALVWLKERSGE